MVALLSLFAELLFLKTSQEVSVWSSVEKASLFAAFLFSFLPFFSTLFFSLSLSLPLCLSPSHPFKTKGLC